MQKTETNFRTLFPVFIQSHIKAGRDSFTFAPHIDFCSTQDDLLYLFNSEDCVKGPYHTVSLQYMSLFFVYISHKGNNKPTHFSQNSFIYEISICLHFVHIQ